ncbi:MAG: hypothetical protein ACE5EG_10140, partial [Thermoanaerobaculia bacterium]
MRADRRNNSLLAVALLAAACSAAPQPKTSTPVPTPPAADPVVATPESAANEEESRALAVLYADLQSQIDAFETGIQLLQEGREELGMAQLAAAGSRIRHGTASCAELVGCDIDLFISAYDYLLDEQSEALRSQGFRLAEAEATLAEESPREEGTGPFRGKMPELERSLNLFKGTDLSQLIELNGPVRAALDDWLTWMRPNLKTAWHN